MQYCIQSEETDGPVTPLFTVPEFRQRLLRLDGGGDEQRDAQRDEVLYVLVGRAPDHFHRYDEVVYVLGGEGAFHVDGESAALHAGSCVHLPARLVHCLENHGPDEMRVLGVFRPAGSPAEAYYPDGSAAVVPAAG